MCFGTSGVRTPVAYVVHVHAAYRDGGTCTYGAVFDHMMLHQTMDRNLPQRALRSYLTSSSRALLVATIGVEAAIV